MARRGRTLLLLGLAVSGACDHGPTEPDDAARRAIAILAGDGQFGIPGQTLADPLEVIVTDGTPGERVEGAVVTWRLVQGSGAVILPPSLETDSLGVARVRIQLGPDTGLYRIEASISRGASRTTVFRLRGVLAPEVLGVEPAAVSAGDTVTVTGRNFSSNPGDNTVVFGSFPGAVIQATPTQLRAVVPLCLPSRSELPVTVRLGAVTSPQAAYLSVSGVPISVLHLDVGEAQALTVGEGLLCIQLPQDELGGTYLVVPQNVRDVPGRTLPFSLFGMTGEAPVVVAAGDEPVPEDRGSGGAAIAWEDELRARERLIDPDEVLRPGPRLSVQQVAPALEIGNRREFNVINKDDEFTKVTAEVVAITERAILFQDVNAPSGGFGHEDFMQLGRLFDDPIYGSLVSTFGAPSDIDGNGKVIILFTPVVNQMTPANSKENGIIAGFFYGFDLTGDEGSNRAEIFYSLVPDAEGKFGNRLSRSEVFQYISPVLAHEFQHMIAFNQRVLVRKAAPEEMWLSEGLAHMAEDVVSQVLSSRGDLSRAATFSFSNVQRARRFLENTGGTSLLADRSPGTVAERGAGWLLVKYIAGQYGGDDVLRRMVQTTRAGIENAAAATGRDWESLFNEWSVALWADDAPELAGIPIDVHYTFPNLNLRKEVELFGAFPLVPSRIGFDDFQVSGALAAGAATHFLLRVPRETSPGAFSIALTGGHGLPFAPDRSPQLAVLRIR